MKEIKAAVKRNIEANNQNMINRMFDSGLKAITEARENADFLNHSFDLRSSFGVAVALNGRIIKSDFKLFSGNNGENGEEGLRSAKELINEIVRNYPSTTVLILVAAEKYAGFVEDKGRLVLTNFTFDIEDTLIAFAK